MFQGKVVTQNVIYKTKSYKKFIAFMREQLSAEDSCLGQEEKGFFVRLKINEMKSPYFFIRHSDFYLIGVAIQPNINQLKMLPLQLINYDDSDSNINVATIQTACQSMAKWATGVSNDIDKAYLKLIIFIISEAARFEPVKTAVWDVLHNYSEIKWFEWAALLRSWADTSAALPYTLNNAGVAVHIGVPVKMNKAHLFFAPSSSHSFEDMLQTIPMDYDDEADEDSCCSPLSP